MTFIFSRKKILIEFFLGKALVIKVTDFSGNENS